MGGRRSAVGGGPEGREGARAAAKRIPAQNPSNRPTIGRAGRAGCDWLSLLPAIGRRPRPRPAHIRVSGRAGPLRDPGLSEPVGLQGGPELHDRAGPSSLPTWVRGCECAQMCRHRK